MSGNILSDRAFEELFREYYPFLCTFAKKYVGDTDECKDIVHQVFLHLWQKRHELNLDTSLKSYLFKSVHNRCLNYIRDHKKIVRHDLIMETEAIPDYVESRDYLEQSELEMRVKKAIDELPQKCREVFMLSRFEEKRYQEIAKELGISVKAVEAHISKALKTLREKLADYLIILLILTLIIVG